MLGNWIRSWTQPDGAIHGFHNHSVWGGNPYRWNDWTCGHSTWASPFLAGLALALRQRMNPDGLTLLERLIDFQTRSFQPDGNYRHIGFQVGETLKSGLIHNAIANASLAAAAWHGREFLRPGLLDQIRRAFDQNTAWHGRASASGTCNQEYARVWGKLLYQRAFDSRRWYDELPADLDLLIKHFHVGGFPDGDCEATWRASADHRAVEPAEYYGLMILPLVMAFETYGERRYLDHAKRLCRHVVRSAWADRNGATRLHRLWYARDSIWQRMREPMLIAGMGDTLEGISACLRHEHDEEMAAFLAQCDATYARYQNPRGYFASATGWQSEVDIAPSTAWHAHDFRYLVGRHPIDDTFWTTFFAPYERTSVLLGDQCYWIERGAHWSIADYFWQDVFCLIGRKDEKVFGRDMAWIPSERALPQRFKFPNPPQFLKDDNAIRLIDGDWAELDVTSIASVPLTR